MFLDHKETQEKMVSRVKWDPLAQRVIKAEKEILGLWVVLDQEVSGEKLVQ